MELWIRSQDKEMLYKAEKIYLNYSIFDELGIKEYYIDVNFDKFGIYKSKERALEVLDEIQEVINNGGVQKEEFNVISGSYHTIYEEVYEMPKE